MTDVVMPQMGESIVEGTLTKWLKKTGDRVERDEPLFEISTDKVDTEIPAPAAGTLAEVLVEEGATVGINTVVGRIDDGGGVAAKPTEKKEAKKAAEPAPQKPAPKAKPAPPPTEAPPSIEAPPPSEASPEEEALPPESLGPLSPLVRRMARENNIDLGKVKGTGAGGRITKQDVEAYMAQPAATPAPQPTRAAASPTSQTPTPQTPPPAGAQPKTRVEPLSQMRIRIAEHMVMSKRTSPHVTTVHRADMTKVAKLREAKKAVFQTNYGFSLTYLPFVARAAVAGLRE